MITFICALLAVIFIVVGIFVVTTMKSFMVCLTFAWLFCFLALVLEDYASLDNQDDCAHNNKTHNKHGDSK